MLNSQLLWLLGAAQDNRDTTMQKIFWKLPIWNKAMRASGKMSGVSMGWFSWETHGVFHCWQCSSVWNIRGLLSIVPPSNSGKCPGTSNSRRDNIEVSLGGETQTDVAEVKLVGGFNPPKKIENMWKYVKPETRKSVLGQHKQQK